MSDYLKTLFLLAESNDEWNEDDDGQYQANIDLRKTEEKLHDISQRIGFDLVDSRPITYDVSTGEVEFRFFDSATFEQLKSLTMIGNALRVEPDPFVRDAIRVTFTLTVDLVGAEVSGVEPISEDNEPIRIRLSKPSEDSPVARFMIEYEKETYGHPFLPRARLLTFTPEDMVIFEVTRSTNNPDEEIRLQYINALPRKSGYGSLALKWFTELADKHGVRIEGLAKRPEGLAHDKDTLPTPKLKSWYTRNGFSVERDGSMTRPATPKNGSNT